MDLHEIFSIKSSETFNKEFDNFLYTTKIIPKEILIKFNEAYLYDNITTVNWVISKLKILKNRVSKKEIFKVEGYGQINDLKFKALVKTKYPNVYQDLFKR